MILWFACEGFMASFHIKFYGQPLTYLGCDKMAVIFANNIFKFIFLDE